MSRCPQWSYGITTVPGRRCNLFAETLDSLRLAGFDEPRLFVDGCDEVELYSEFNLPVTLRSSPALRTAGNWTLSLYELYIRNPNADRYAIFQDDFVTYRNLRSYLSCCEYPETGYWNLYTFPQNQRLAPSRTHVGWYPSNQWGRGAVALVFSRQAVVTLLSSLHLTERPQDSRRGWKAIDGGIVESMKKAGWTEFVHNPSLVQHTGRVSSMGNSPHAKAVSFKGVEFDAEDLIP